MKNTILIILLSNLYLNTFCQSGAGSSIKLDGYDDYVLVPHSGSLLQGQTLTVEAWINPTTLPINEFGSVNTKSIIQKYYSNAGYYLNFSKLSNDYKFNFFVAGDNGSGSFVSAIVIPDVNKWVHLCGTFDGHTSKIYINGKLANTGNTYAGNLTFALAIQNLKIGNFVSPGGNDFAYGGNVDEVRIWNKELSELEIRERMCRKIKSNDPFFSYLKAYYNFDENSGNSVLDQSGNNNTGTLTQGLLNSPTLSTNPNANPNGPQRTTSGAGIADNSAFNYGGPTSTTNLSNIRGDNLNIALQTGTANGLQIYNVNEPPTVTTGIAGQLPNSNYFGVVVDNPTGNPLTYTATFNYGGITGITDESQLRLFRRDNPADPTWEDSGAILDQTANTLTVTGINTEYILGLASAPLPVSLISFSGKKEENAVKLIWKTANEKGFSHFEIEKSEDSKSFQKIGEVRGNKSEIYEFIDSEHLVSNIQHLIYYRIKMLDLDEKMSLSKIITVDFGNNEENFTIENPAENGQILVNTNIQNPNFILVNGLGQKSDFSIAKFGENKYSLQTKNTALGIYYLMINNEGKVLTKKVLVKY